MPRNIAEPEQAWLKSWPKGHPIRNALIVHFIVRNNEWNNMVNTHIHLVRDGARYRINPNATTKRRRPIDKLPKQKKQFVPISHKISVGKGDSCPDGYYGPVSHNVKSDKYERATDIIVIERQDGTSGELNQRDFSLDRASSSKFDPCAGNINTYRAGRLINRSAAPGKTRAPKARKRLDKNQLCPGYSDGSLAPKSQTTRRKADKAKMAKAIAAMK
jgi:hypothetical protein